MVRPIRIPGCHQFPLFPVDMPSLYTLQEEEKIIKGTRSPGSFHWPLTVDGAVAHGNGTFFTYTRLFCRKMEQKTGMLLLQRKRRSIPSRESEKGVPGARPYAVRIGETVG